jgi:K+-sensing histidine kinase KdpD
LKFARITRQIRPNVGSATMLTDAPVAVCWPSGAVNVVVTTPLLMSALAGSTEPAEVLVSRDGDLWQIDIADRGTGFGDVDPEHLFQAFHTTKKSGTGLGLAIVRRLASLQGGTVQLLHRRGGGAIARVTLPAASLKP